MAHSAKVPVPGVVRWQRAGLFLGVAGFAIVLALPTPDGLTDEGRRAGAVAVLMAAWWISEAVPIPVTALVPLVLFPLLEVLGVRQTAQTYADPAVFLFMGGFMIALAMQKWGLHRRVGAYVVAWVGASPARLLFGVMAATAFISMWVSNTATAMMMLPIALAALAQLGMQPGHDGGKGRLAAAVMLGVAYAASIGGVATLVGTPPNLIFIGQARELAPDAEEVTFLKWMAFALPMALGFLLIAWAYLAFVVARVPKSESIPSAAGQSPAPARWSRGELGVLAVFLVTVVAWIWRADIDVGAFTIKGWSTLAGLKDVQDGTIAMAAALALFLLPADWKKREFLLDWDWARRLPWDVLLLFGGGFALAEAFQATGLGAWLASGMDGLEGVPTVLVVAVVCLFTTFLSELMSNTAIAALMMPVMAATATALGIHPYTLMVPAAISASFSFMLPTGTPPNAIVFGSGHVTMRQMARSGLALNLLGVVWVTLLMYVLVIPVLGLD